MSKVIRITTPLTPKVCHSLKAGDCVLISGRLVAARDAAHKRLLAALEEGSPLPFELRGAVIYYVGPAPARPVNWPANGVEAGACTDGVTEAAEQQQALLPTTSAGPTTSGRMDKYTPALLALGLSGMIGKGDRQTGVIEAMQKYGAVYFATTGGAGALLAKSIKKYNVLAWPELGPEALAEMYVEDFPAIVAIDCLGNNIYKTGPLDWAGAGKKKNSGVTDAHHQKQPGPARA